MPQSHNEAKEGLRESDFNSFGPISKNASPDRASKLNPCHLGKTVKFIAKSGCFDEF